MDPCHLRAPSTATIPTHRCAPPRCRYAQVDADSYRCSASGEIHRGGAACTLRLPNRDATLICPISGRCFDQSIAVHPFQRRTTRVLVDTATAALPPPPHRRTTTTTNAPPQRSEFRAAVLRVLAPKKRRGAAIEERIEYYVESSALFWGKLVATSYGRGATIRLRVLDVVLGLLYTMRVGMRCPRTNSVALVRDAVLARSLPSVQSVAESGIPKKLIRVGKNHVRCAVVEMCCSAPEATLPLYPAFHKKKPTSD